MHPSCDIAQVYLCRVPVDFREWVGSSNEAQHLTLARILPRRFGCNSTISLEFADYLKLKFIQVSTIFVNFKASRDLSTLFTSACVLPVLPAKVCAPA